MLSSEEPYEAASDYRISFDSGVPLAITWPEYDIANKYIYYSIINSSGAMIELKFAEPDRRLCEVVVVVDAVGFRGEMTDFLSFEALEDKKVLSWTEGVPPPSFTESEEFSGTLYRDAIAFEFTEQSTVKWTYGRECVLGWTLGGEVSVIGVRLGQLARHQVAEALSL